MRREKGSFVTLTTLLCYDPDDGRMAIQLKKHLSPLERNGLIALRDSSNINPGAKWEQEMEYYLNNAQIILLLISASFLASHYCYTIQMQRAIKRHERKEARVIPVLLRPVHWKEPPLDKLQALPDRAKPIAKWANRDEAFTNVVDGIVKVIEQWDAHNLSDPTTERKTLMAQLDRLIETVKLQMQPDIRSLATAGTLQQLSIFIPNEATLADLVVGWQILSHARTQQEEIAIARRRITCGELANMTSQFMTGQGNLAQAIKTWRIWLDAFKNSNDPRQATMASTFARELAELQAALP